MSVTTLDTHETVKELLAAGFSDDQAEAVTRVVRRAQDIDLSNLATKTDLLAIRADLVATKVELKADLQAGLAETKADLLKWMVGSIGFQTVVILGAVVALAKTIAH